MNPDPNSPHADPNEARITAFLLGELPPAAAEQLRRDLSADPDLARLHDRIKFTLDLVQEAVTGRSGSAPAADPTGHRLADHRRQALLEQFRSTAPIPTVPTPRRRPTWLIPMAIAASLVALLGIAPWLPWSPLPPSEATRLAVALRKQVDDLARRSESAPRGASANGPATVDNGILTSPTEAAPGGNVTFWNFQPPLLESGRRPAVSTTAIANVTLGLREQEKVLPEGLTAREPPLAQSPQLMRRYGLAPTPRPVMEAQDARKAGMDAVTHAGSQAPEQRPPETDRSIPPSSTASPASPSKAESTSRFTTLSSSTRESLSNDPTLRQERADRIAASSGTAGAGGFGGGGAGGPVVLGGIDAATTALGAEAAPNPVTPPTDQKDGTKRAGIDSISDESKPQVAFGASFNPPSPGTGPADPVASPQFRGAQALHESLGETPPEARAKSKASSAPLADLPALAYKESESLKRLSKPHAGVPEGSTDETEVRQRRLNESRGLEQLRLARKADQSPGAVTADIAFAVGDIEAPVDKESKSSLARQDQQAAKRALSPPIPQPEVVTAENQVSTFSLNVTDVSFKLAAASLEQGAMPDPATIRSEEFINAFDYRDPEPPTGTPVGLTWERAQYPFAHRREILRLAVRTSATGRPAGRPLHLVLLLDNSGSMERADRAQIVRESLRVLAGRLQPHDLISVVTFARNARLWIEALPGDRAAELAERVGRLTPEGGTNLEEGLNLAYATVAKHFRPEALHRIALMTDGAANLGELDHPALERLVDSWRRRGVALDCYGIGWEGYNDDLLARLSRHGDGRYGFMNTVDQAPAEFARQLAGALQIAAADLKVQVEFNPQRVRNWRQIGYARHQLAAEQFRDNSVDAAELASAETGTALYVIETIEDGTGPLGVVRIRHREPGSQRHHEQDWPLPHTGASQPLETAPASLKLAVTGAAFSEWLAGSPFAGDITPDRLLQLVQTVPAAYAPDPRPQQLEAMLRQAKSISGK